MKLPGIQDALPLVFLHGWLSDASDWAPVADGIGDKPILRPDLVPRAGWEESIRQVTTSLPPCVLVGYSMGGRVALATALAPDSPARGLVLISANPGLEQERERESRAASDKRLLGNLTEANREAFLEAWFQQSLFQSVDAATRRRWIDERASLDLTRQRGLLQCLGIAGQPNFWPHLARLSIPTLLITGELDTKYREILLRMSGHLPDAEAVVMPGASHAPHREQPALVRSLVESWYDRRFRDDSSPAPAFPRWHGGVRGDVPLG